MQISYYLLFHLVTLTLTQDKLDPQHIKKPATDCQESLVQLYQTFEILLTNPYKIVNIYKNLSSHLYQANEGCFLGNAHDWLKHSSCKISSVSLKNPLCMDYMDMLTVAVGNVFDGNMNFADDINDVYSIMQDIFLNCETDEEDLDDVLLEPNEIGNDIETYLILYDDEYWDSDEENIDYAYQKQDEPINNDNENKNLDQHFQYSDSDQNFLPLVSNDDNTSPYDC